MNTKIKKSALSPIQVISSLWFSKMKFNEPVKFSGADSILKLADKIVSDGAKHILIASSRSVIRFEMLKTFIESIERHGIEYTIFTDITPDPTIENIEAGLTIYKNNGCDRIVAVGGGSVLDCAKLIALRASNEKISVRKMTNYLAVLKDAVPFYAVPTTAGSGSEITMFAVITDTEKKKKCPVLTPKIMPIAVALDPVLAIKVPQNITAFTGMDALTHAVEAYISTFADKFPSDKQKAPGACKAIFANLEKAYNCPDDIEARQNLCEASFDAGVAFRRISTGYVHAIAHRLGESYHIPHGYANAVLLPYVLEAYMPSVAHDLSELSHFCGFGDKILSDEENAKLFIKKIIQLNKSLNISNKIPEINKNDYNSMLKRINSEANLQGCPVRLSSSQIISILNRLA